MSRTDRNAMAFIALYALFGLLTFGMAFNASYVEQPDCGPRPTSTLGPEYAAWSECRFPPFETTAKGAGFPAAMSGFVWPLYWAGKLAIVITR